MNLINWLKKLSVIFIVFLFVTGCSENKPADEETMDKSNEKANEEVKDSNNKLEKIEQMEQPDLENEKQVEKFLTTIVKEFESSEINDLELYTDKGTIDLYLSFTANEEPEVVKETIKSYNNLLGIAFNGTVGLQFLNVYWEAPSLKEEENVIIVTIEQEEVGMYIEDEWYDPEVF